MSKSGIIYLLLLFWSTGLSALDHHVIEKNNGGFPPQANPVFLFEFSLTEAGDKPGEVAGADIEIYNRTQKRTERSIQRHPETFLRHTFNAGNHYTLIIRKPGYLTQRVDIRIQSDGCTLCVDGLNKLNPELRDKNTAGDTRDTLAVTIEMVRAEAEKHIVVESVYYDYDKWDIRPDAALRLDYIAQLMKDNPGLSVELGSHTDSRGNDAYNLLLTQRRADNAVAYLVREGITGTRITAKGYGETRPLNHCSNGVDCTEGEHEKNRRTELRITSFHADPAAYDRWPGIERVILEEEAAQRKKTTRQEPPPPPPAKKLSTPDGGLPLSDLKFAPAGKSADAPLFAVDKPAVVKPFPAGFTGYSIIIATTARALEPGKDALLNKYPEIFLHRDAAGNFVYLIEQFTTRSDAEQFLQKTALKTFPDARAAKFVQGVVSGEW